MLFGLLIAVLIFCAIGAVIYYLIPEPFKKIAFLILGVFIILWLVSLLYGGWPWAPVGMAPRLS